MLTPIEMILFGLAVVVSLYYTWRGVERIIKNINSGKGKPDWNVVKNYELRLPSLPEQTAIAEVLSDMDAELAALEQRLAKTRPFKQGMMQELLTGRTRLV